MRKIVTAVSAASLALSMLAMAVPAGAVTGYDSAYAGESAFVNISPGQTQNFQVFFANTGTTTWSRGTGTQVDLAACLSDKVTCNAQDSTEASWNSGWLSATRYATTVQTTTAPGSLGTFSYNITAPVGAANGTYRFNGDLVLSSTGEKIHPDGYYQDATIGTGTGGGGAATITGLDPDSGTTAGGDNVVITGTGITCTPAFPAVSFGTSNAVVVSCGSTSVTATSPAHASGDVTVTVTNSGAGASNGLTFSYEDQDAPVFTSMAVSGDLLTVTFSEGVCTSGTPAASDWTVRNISDQSGDLATGASFGANVPNCADDETATSFTITLSTAPPPGALVEATLNETTTGANANYEDSSGNAAAAPQARQATATSPETTKPDLSSAQGNVGATTITLTFSEPIWCTNVSFNPVTDITVDNLDSTDPVTVTGYGSDSCTTVRAEAETTFNITINTAIEADSDYKVTITDKPNVQDAANNDLDNATATFRAGAGDFTPPTIVDARVAANVGTTDFTETGDAFSMTFSEVMNENTTGSIQIQDEDGTVFTLHCGAGTNPVTCDWNTAVTAMTVTLAANIVPPPVGSAGAGNTPGMQIPFNITTLTGFSDEQGNVPNVLGSSDRKVDYE